MNKETFKSCKRISLLPATLIAMGLASAVQAQNSPIGTWDCVISGNRQGTAYFQFFDNGTNRTFSVTEAIVPNTVSTNSSIGRGGTTIGRGGSSSSSFVPGVQIFGGAQVTNGFWGFDSKGHTIGSFVETSTQLHCTTTPIPFDTNSIASDTNPPVTVTNNPTTDPVFCASSVLLGSTNLGGGVTNYTSGDVCFTNVTTCTATTNPISFVGTVSTKRIILKASTPFGPTTYRGVPAQTLPDITGGYFGIKRQNGVEFVEFLTMTNENPLDIQNIYDVALSGPGYTYSGLAILSSQKRISFWLSQTPAIATNPPAVVRAVTGPFNAKTHVSTTTGWDSTDPLKPVPANRIRFTVAPEQAP